MADLSRCLGCLLLALHYVIQEATSVYYHNLSLNFLCDSHELSPYVRDMPWDCSAYVVCAWGRAIPNQCPPGKAFSGAGRHHKCLPSEIVNHTRCVGTLFNYTSEICQNNPTARIPSPESCSLYIDCTNVPAATENQTSWEFLSYLLECPYPQLFSADTGGCQHHTFVNCRHREEPKAPCDYLQYLQLYDCNNRTCPSCQRHHPSCVGRPDGPHPVPDRPSVLMECFKDRTVNIAKCPPGDAFDQQGHLCARDKAGQL